MASSSSSSSSERQCKYDVFLNFRGEDTRKIFVGHLHKALEQRGLNTFIDSEDVGKGNDFSVLLKAITDSKLSIVVFSRDYASSTWCLQELVQILKCNDTQKQIVVPIFYQLDPSHVRKQEASFAQAFLKHESNRDSQEVQSWRSALTQAANFSGWDSRDCKDDAKFIDAIAVDVFQKLIHVPSSDEVNDGLVGMDFHMHNMRRLLSLSGGKADVVYVGIWGMGGIGKTTIARVVYNNIAHLFEHRCFLHDVGEGFKSKGRVQMQVEFLSTILNEKVKSLDGGYMMIMKRLGDRKILVVLDDVDDSNQIDTLLGMKRSFGSGSKIIVTTRDDRVLQPRDEFMIYKPEPLSEPDGLKLFSWYAFKTNKPSKEYDHLSRRALEYAQGLPLALQILGSHLHKRSVSVWIDELEKIKKIPNSGIQRVLRTSYDGLDDSQKKIFLDIACFYKGLHIDYVTQVLASFNNIYPGSGLEVLLEKALVTISKFGGLEMHDLLQKMGREIFHSKSPKKPWNRSRLWSFEDVQDVLTQSKGTKVEGIIVELSNSGDINLNAKGFASLKNLRLLRITYPQYLGHFYKCFEGESWPEQLYNSYWECIGNFHLHGDLKFISHEMRVLAWHSCPLKSLPPNFDPKNLIDLDMRGSHIEQLWVGTKRIKELISINLSSCKYLKEVPLCTEATKLEKLILDGCISLLEVHPSISALENLVFLSLEDCTKLKRLPSSIHHLKSLKFLDLYGCSNLKKFPEILEDMEALLELKLDGTAIKELPSSIERLRRLKSLSMKSCTRLARLPDSICNLAYLTYLYLSGCSKLHNLPKNFGRLESLLELKLEYSGIEQLPVSILHLKLGRLIFKGCEQMKAPISSWRSSSIHSIEGRWTAVLFIDFSYSNLLELSDAIVHFSSLKILKLSRTNLESLPARMNRLVFLERLELQYCKRLKSIPELSSSVGYINADDCTALETVSTPKRPYDMGRCFRFSNCDRLVQNDLFRDIVETHFPPQGNYSRPFNMSFPGREIPERFIHQCGGSSVTAQLPPNWVNNKFLGFAICAVSGCLPISSSFQCFCTFTGNHGEYRFSFYLFHEISEIFDGYFTGDHMFLGYVPWSEFGISGQEVNERCYTEAKFEIQILHKFDSKLDCYMTRRCGVQFFFANNEEVAHHDFGEPMVHSEGSVEGSSAEPSGSDATSDIYDEEHYENNVEGSSAEPSGSDATIDISDEEHYENSVEWSSAEPSGSDTTSDISDEEHYENNLEGYSAEPSSSDTTSDISDEEHYESNLEGSSAEPSSSDTTSDISDEEHYENSLEGSSVEPSGSDTTSDISDEEHYENSPDEKQYLKLTEIFGGAQRNFRDYDCEIQDNDSSGKRKILSKWTQQVRVTSGQMQGHLDDGFSWNPNHRILYLDVGTKFEYTCIHRPSCEAKSELRISTEDPTILDITYIGRHTCWKTLPMLTYQVRLTPGMGLEGPSDGFSWEKYCQLDMLGDKYPSVYYVCTPQNVQGCMAIKEVQYANDDQTILKITYRGRHTCTRASSISIGGKVIAGTPRVGVH